MTQIRGFIPPSKRPGELGVHSVDHFALVVPDMAVAQGFYGSFGLDLKPESNKVGLYTLGNAHRWGVVTEGAKKKLQYLSFGAFEEDFEGIRNRIQRQGVRRMDPPPGFDSNGIWFQNPDGLIHEVSVAEKCSPNQKSSFDNPTVDAGARGADSRGNAPAVHPRRMAHILMFTRDVPRSIAFYQEVLGLRLSDHSADAIAFMHGIHGSDHHMLAFAKSDAPGLHHCSWDVASVNDIGLGAMRMADKGYSKGWGMGRHVLGSNYFHYVKDPWGSYCEYSSDIDYIPSDCDWPAADHPGEDSIYLWGPQIPEDFVFNYEAGNAE